MTDKDYEKGTTAEIKNDDLEPSDAAQNDEWQDDLPPEDDFHDHDELPDDVGDEGLGEEAGVEESEDEVAQAERVKRGKTVFFGILVVGVLVIGGLAYLQFGTTSTGTGGPVPVSSVLNVSGIRGEAKNSSQMNPGGVSEGNVNAKTGSVDLETMYNPSQPTNSKNALPNSDTLSLVSEDTIKGASTEILTSSSDMPTAIAPAGALPPKPEAAQPAVAVDMAAAPQIEAAPAHSASVEPSVGSPSPVDSLKPVPVSLGAHEKPAVRNDGPADSGAATAEMEARLKALTDQIETLKKALDGATAQNVELLSRIDALQNQKTAETLSGKSVVDVKPVVKDKQKDVVVKAEQSIEPVVLVPTVQKAKAPKKAKAEKRAAPKKTAVSLAAPVDKGSQWVLRAATPDAAWVSMTRDSMELRRVAVGESLPGLGRVKEIRQSGDAWQLVGETGVLK